MSARYQVDIAPVDQENAPALVVHHLALAMGYFQALPEGGERDALEAQVMQRFQGFGMEEEIASRFVEDICSKYDELKEDD